MWVGVSYLPNIGGLVKHEQRWTLSGCIHREVKLEVPRSWRNLASWVHLRETSTVALVTVVTSQQKPLEIRDIQISDWHAEAVLALAADMGAEEWSEDGNSWALLHVTHQLSMSSGLSTRGIWLPPFSPVLDVQATSCNPLESLKGFQVDQGHECLTLSVPQQIQSINVLWGFWRSTGSTLTSTCGSCQVGTQLGFGPYLFSN